ncbi:wall-associated receptor kinase 2-like [Cucumis melo]|uniref:Wall-associated receptor kinase 2-like n=1 Tax=Cucumis melo TaxID=3656 RepID=A0A1S3B4I0_CUCME|nr:wall-associated receptor kinase 2-like [Cucumis melo]
MGRPTAKKLVRLIMAIVVNIAIFLAATASSSVPPQAKVGCKSKCGNLEIPYPFGITEKCYLNINFSIECRTQHNREMPFLMKSNIGVTNISLHGEIHVLNYVARACSKSDGSLYSNKPYITVPMFTISNTKNKFTVIGCDTYAYIFGKVDGESYRSGCMALCGNSTESIKDGPCSGSGCCQLEIPEGLKRIDLVVGSFNNYTTVNESINPCGYAFVIEENSFEFKKDYLTNYTEEEVPLVLDWRIKSDTCPTDKCLCGPKSQMIMNGSEYYCQCQDGFHGNPYLDHGCQDINECEEGSNLCVPDASCENAPAGNYTCHCPEKYEGDGRHGGTGCRQKYSNSKLIQIAIGTGVGFTVFLIAISWLYLGYKKWRFIQRKEEFFKKNGGTMLQQHLSQWQSPTDTVRIFSQEELEKATNKFNESTVVGKGGYGTVHKGVLADGSVIAIKKSQLVDQSQTSQFINEVIVLSQVNHRNVVKLLGCCLETEVPLLVYEFITNGTLFDHIHDRTINNISWEARLRIASETAGVISYLHSSASTPIIHRDIKSTNILLDNNLTAKVSDFGASKLVPMDQTQLSTMVQGTLGYLDPEYLSTSELTEKSDVYSFGIVLLELITGKKAVSFDGPEAERNLAKYVLCAMKEDRLAEVVDKKMVMDEGKLNQIKEVSKIAKECVRVRGEERPNMKEVAMELEGLKVMQVKHSWINNNLSNSEEMISLLDETSNSTQFLLSSSMNPTNDNSITTHILTTHIPDAR